MNKLIFFAFVAIAGIQTVSATALANPEPIAIILPPIASVIVNVNANADLEVLKLGLETIRTVVNTIRLNVDLNVQITLIFQRLFINLSLFNPCNFQCPNCTCTQLSVNAVVQIQLTLRLLVLVYNDLLDVLVGVDVDNILDALANLIACLGGLLNIDINLLGGQCSNNDVVANANATIILAANNLLNLNATVNALIQADLNIVLNRLIDILIRLELQLTLCISLQVF